LSIYRLLRPAGRLARTGICVVSIALAASGCGRGDLFGGAITGSSPSTSAATSPTPTPTPSNPTPTPTPSNPAPVGNRAPSINGNPPSTARVSQLYDFTPSAFDPDNNPLRFEITGKPIWASFDPNTGRLYGTPPAGTSGTFGGVEILVTDGQAKTALPVFSILVLNAQQAASGSAALSWTRPSQNTDGSSLTDLAGYRVYYGQDPSAQSSSVEITDPAATGTSIAPLAVGTWYFAISSFNKAGVESARTGPVSLTIG
jgi:hypothetical protein